jgi:glycerol dehydrogenase
MNQTAIFPGRYVQGEGALEDLGGEAARLGRMPLIIAGHTAIRSIIPGFKERWLKELDFASERFRGESCELEIRRLGEIASGLGSDLIIGMGGGKALDTAKAVAYELRLPVVIVPTIASTDAPCSAVSVIYSPEGRFERYLFLSSNPNLVLVDTAVIAEAPVRFLVAGMGDALATWFEADSCRRSSSANQCGGVGTLASYTLARLCYDTILEHGVAAKAACLSGVVTPALSHVVEANTLLSGLGFECAGLAAAHSIHNGFTLLPETHDYYHGEKVGLGVLAALFLADHPGQLVDEVYGFCESVGLPTTLEEIGLGQASDVQLRVVAQRACAEGETIHHELSPVSPATVLAALKTADTVGADRKLSRPP